MKKTFNSKIFYLLFFFILSMFISNKYLDTFENNFFFKDRLEYSSIYTGDSISYFKEAEKIRQDTVSGKSFLVSGGAYKFSLLYPRIIYIFNNVMNDNGVIITNDKIEFDNYRLFIFVQIFIYFFSIVFLYLTISKILQKELSTIICTVLLINPVIFQWHLSFLTESIFLSGLIFLISFLIKSKNNYHFFLLGFFVGILYSIRTIAILYPLVIIIYLICIDQKNIHKIIKSLSLIVGMILVLLLIGLHNYKRADVFYFTPMQSKMDLQTYFVPGILIRSEDFNTLTQVEIAKIYKKMKQNILNNKDYDLTKEKDQILVAGDVLKNSLNIIFDNKIIFLKMISKNYFYSMLLNPVQVYFTSKYQKWEDYKNSLQHKYWLKIRVIFTIIFFSLSVLGFFCSLKKISLKLNIFFFLSTLYFFFTSCWLGNTRYFTPSSLFLSFYFSLAINKFYFKFFHKIKTLT